MKIIFAQGNPGKQYERTRHNSGFIVLDALASKEGGSWHTDSKFKADISEIQLAGEKLLLVKPQSFYNETGQTARSLIDFYKLDPSSSFLVIHDELALPFGTIRVREKGSDAGNNGIKSLNSHLGGDYSRIRIGVWNEDRERMDDAAFVLSAFSIAEAETFQGLIRDPILPLIEAFARGTLASSSHRAE